MQFRLNFGFVGGVIIYIRSSRSRKILSRYIRARWHGPRMVYVRVIGKPCPGPRPKTRPDSSEAESESNVGMRAAPRNLYAAT